MISTPKISIIKSILLLSYLSFLATILLTAKSYGEKSTITDLSTLQLALCSAASITIPIARHFKKFNPKPTTWITWILLAIGFAFLAMDDKFMFHERLDKAIHSALQWHETKLSDRIDDIIVGAYGLIGLIFIVLNRLKS